MHANWCVLIEISMETGMLNFWLGLLVTALTKETYFIIIIITGPYTETGVDSIILSVPLQILRPSTVPDTYWLSNCGFQWPFMVQQGRYQSKIENRNVNDSSTQFSASDEWCLNFVIVREFFQWSICNGHLDWDLVIFLWLSQNIWTF